MRVTIGIKIFGIAVGLLILMAVVALLSMRMTRTVDDQLVIIDQNYFPAYVALAQANIRSVEESAYARRLLLAIAERPDNAPKLDDLRQRIASAGKASDEQIAAARQHINEQIADPLDFDDNIALARLDVRIESLQQERRRYEAVLGKLLATLTNNSFEVGSIVSVDEDAGLLYYTARDGDNHMKLQLHRVGLDQNRPLFNVTKWPSLIGSSRLLQLNRPTSDMVSTVVVTASGFVTALT